MKALWVFHAINTTFGFRMKSLFIQRTDNRTACLIIIQLSLLLPLFATPSRSSRLHPRQADSDHYCPDYRLDNGQPLDIGCFNISLWGYEYPDEGEYIAPQYFFYKRSSSFPELQLSWESSLQTQRSDLLLPNDRIVVVVHGFTDSRRAHWMTRMRDELFFVNGQMHNDISRQMHVILVDWERGSEGPDYEEAARNVDMVARLSAALLQRLASKYNLKERNIHLIGHSLGGQIVGYMIYFLFTRYGIKVGRATGLDTASPFFEEKGIWPQREYCHFLEAVHTSCGNNIIVGKFGLGSNYAHIDLYPNGGTMPQPGCPIYDFKHLACSHNLARDYYILLLNLCFGTTSTNLNVTSCTSAADAQEQLCNGDVEELCELMFDSRTSIEKTIANPHQSRIVLFPLNGRAMLKSGSKVDD